ncbi:hypothetical protein BKH44_00760 [Helicobacter sp. 13S00477-4]|nr:hypothetical protein BKH44_00760 [Helicobacter sp. 13S00477-4]
MAFDEKYVLHTYARRKIRFSFGDGAKLYTPCSKQFIDFGSGIGVCSVGHGNKKLFEAIAEQTRDLIHLSNIYLIEYQALLAKKIIELCGYDMRIFFSNSKREANECAIKIARKFGKKNTQTTKDKIIILESSFYEFMDDLFLEKILKAKNINQIYDLIDEETCAVFIHLTYGEDGLGLQKQEVQKLTKILKEKNILLMVDETHSGVYRCGEFFASKIYGIVPDVVTISNGLGGGVPIAATLSNIKDIFEPGDYGSIFGGNFLSTRAALSVLQILEEEYGLGKISEISEFFNQYLEEVLKKFPCLFEKKIGLGLMCALYVKNEQIQNRILESAFEEQLLILKAGKNLISFLPALNISKEEITEGFMRFQKACEKI